MSAAGADSATELGTLLARYDSARIFLVTGRQSFERSGAEAALRPLLEEASVAHFNDFSPNPTLEEVERGVALCRSHKPTLVLAVGGGSALDIAKMINALAINREPGRDLLTGVLPLRHAGLPLIAIPTTSGSGAEATHFAAVYVDGVKYSLTHESLRPTHFILDPSLTQSLSPYLRAATGMDALSQAIESYWSVRSTTESRALSARAIELCNGALLGAASSPTDDLRSQMMLGANLAGQAIDVARTTAPHALSYVLTADFGVTHGHAVALTLASVLTHNALVSDDESHDPRGPEYLNKMMGQLCTLLGCKDPAEAHTHLQNLMQATGLDTRLRDLGVARDDLPRLVQAVNPQRLANNPRLLSPDALGTILESIY